MNSNSSRYIVDATSYVLLVNGIRQKSYLCRLKVGDIITLIDRANGVQYTEVFEDENNAKNLVFCKLAGGILILPRFRARPCHEKYSLISKIMAGSFVHAEYDGMTHVTIENNDYIYTVSVCNFADVDIENKDDIFLVKLEYDNMHEVIVLRHDMDYIELLRVKGNEIAIDENEIKIKTLYDDILGRIKVESYIMEGGQYLRQAVSFDYRYSVTMNDINRISLIEDAIYAGDYRYIARLMDDAREEDVEDYIKSILKDRIERVGVQPYSRDTMHFIVHSDMVSNVVSLRANFDGNKLLNIGD